MRNIYFIGGGGLTDAGGWAIVNGKIVKIPGWNPEVMIDFSHSIGALRRVSQIKERGVSEVMIKQLMPVVERQMGDHIKEGGIVVVGG